MAFSDFENCSLTEALAHFGVTHRRDRFTRTDGRHVFLRYGREIGRLDASEGWKFVRALCKATEG